MRRFALAPVVAGLLALAAATPAEAYIGPGAGFAIASSFLVIFVTVLLALVSLLILPFRIVWRKLRTPKTDEPLIRRLIVVGLDGQDPRLTDRFMKEGKLPNFAKLAEEGCYTRLRSTYPSISPVAWSSFSTGTHPAKHNIYDFLDRDRRTYLPLLSSTKIGEVERFLKIGKIRLPLHKPELRLLRKSVPFWSILGKHHIWSTVLRVPITFPPNKFYGAQLAAMCVPDLLGTQGTFLLYTTRKADEEFKEGGLRFELEPGQRRWETTIDGPENIYREDGRPFRVPLVIDTDPATGRTRIDLGDEVHEVETGELTDWITLTFEAEAIPPRKKKVTGLVRMMVTESGEHFSLYITPINIDPEKPAMPISHPDFYATYLDKKIGPYATLGLAEDTWALNEKVIDDGTFLEMTYDIDREREKQFFAALDRLRRGSLVCVFDTTDRIQHMFWRYLEDGHPAAAATNGDGEPEHANAIEELYLHNDRLVGRVLERIRDDDLLLVISDHGFTSFRRGINLNKWLYEHGYLQLKEGTDGSSEWLRDVDWSRTRAYSLGLTGMFLNLKGREAEGIVEPGAEAKALKRELIEGLSGLIDEEHGEVGINEVFETAALYQGPYLGNAPDLLVGYNHGYRVSWDCATGMVSGPIFEDNVKAWSGDHGVDPRIVPGVLFSNHAVHDDDPALMDIAPTALSLFGIEPPQHMDGKPLFDRRRFAKEREDAA
ncbi:MAG: alkaline phosphatase family protein [Thermoanaerobaculia bacterium]|nr:alkaline phosphatase family protein [Thermoanaerobaculia bacterium]